MLHNLGMEYLKEVRNRGRDFVNTDKLKSQAMQVARFLTEEQDKCGLFICGRVGNGKSTMIKAVCNVVNALVKGGQLNNEIYPWSYMVRIDARDMVRAFIDSYTNSNDNWRIMKSRRFLAIDDLGKDQKDLSLYGTIFNPFMELLDCRYELQLPTIIASNLSARDVVLKYGDERLADRMTEMFEVLSFEDKSFRV